MFKETKEDLLEKSNKWKELRKTFLLRNPLTFLTIFSIILTIISFILMSTKFSGAYYIGFALIVSLSLFTISAVFGFLLLNKFDYFQKAFWEEYYGNIKLKEMIKTEKYKKDFSNFID